MFSTKFNKIIIGGLTASVLFFAAGDPINTYLDNKEKTEQARSDKRAEKLQLAEDLVLEGANLIITDQKLAEENFKRAEVLVNGNGSPEQVDAFSKAINKFRYEAPDEDLLDTMRAAISRDLRRTYGYEAAASSSFSDYRFKNNKDTVLTVKSFLKKDSIPQQKKHIKK